MKKLDHRFYDNEDVVLLARLLLGKLLVTEISLIYIARPPGSRGVPCPRF